MIESDLTTQERDGLRFALAGHNKAHPDKEQTEREFFEEQIRIRCRGWFSQKLAEREADPENKALVQAVIAASDADRQAIKAFAAERLGLA